MLIHLGRLLMLSVWFFLLYNVVYPVKPPIHYFLYFILAFMAITNCLKVLMMSVMSAKSGPLTSGQKIRLFLFGVFELKAIFKQQQTAQPTVTTIDKNK
ncbi:DUF1145 domain-containing protein [Thorsellia kenyensis]|uniref:DUF1145 domain-containing protein n=1 Tax=Thorsellia kenyensis TaxID=1549888 RepID=A0ABV6CAT3_9GAMM